MTDERFGDMVEEAIAALPKWVRSELINVAFLVEDEPTEQHHADTNTLGDSLFGFYEGIPRTERGNDAPLLPDIITLFKKPILETYQNEEDIRMCIENTIWHEVAHYFGHDEDWVRQEEIRRGKIL